MTCYSDFARQILEGQTLSDKLLNLNPQWTEWKDYQLPALPGRAGALKFSEQQLKFPKSARLKEIDKKAQAIHSFANHELLAIEMMAAALLIYPHQTDAEVKFKQGILTALKDEQKHLNLYIKRLNELGYQFGDFPLNDFFWRQMNKLATPAQYCSVMALTFEAANLDFAQYYATIFAQQGDSQTAQILEEVLKDELSHVSFGSYWMKKWRGDRSLWQYYLEQLPWPLTPARSKGIHFDLSLHHRAIQDEDFEKQLKNFQDDFSITARKG